MSTVDSRFFALFPLQEVIHDKTSGALLSAGIVTFYKDSDRTVKKDIYQQTQSAGPDLPYTYTLLPNPLILSSIGSYVDTDGNDIIPFLFPYEGSPTSSSGAIELYYITVQSSGLVDQFTREAWPPGLSSSVNPGSETFESTQNLLTNPDFSQVLFTPSGHTFTLTGSGTVTQIAPGWALVTSGNGTVALTQLAQTGTSDNEAAGNPPYSLKIVSSGVTQVILRQQLANSPRLMATGFISGTLAAKTDVGVASQFTMTYSPSAGSSHVVVQGNVTADGLWTVIDKTALGDNAVEINGTINPDSSSSGYVNFDIEIPISTTIEIANIQANGVESVESTVQYVQSSVAQMTNNLYWYDRTPLFYKPIKSYLVGWDFPLNPAQNMTTLNRGVVPQSFGANKSYANWDQTIIFQTVNSAVTINANPIGGPFTTLATLTTQLAIIQYLANPPVQEMLQNPLSVYIRATSTVNQTATVSLWYSTDAQLPDLKDPNYNSLVATLDANGKPATFNGTWLEVPRAVGNAQISLVNGGGLFTDYPLSGWDLNSLSAANTATYFAIVVGTDSITAGNVISWEFISLVPGTIPTPPAPQTIDEVQRECNYYFRRSFLPTLVTTTNAGANSGQSYGFQVVGASTNSVGPLIRFDYPMRATPLIALYNPQAGNNEIRNVSAGTDYSSSTTVSNSVSVQGFATQGTTAGGSTAGSISAVNWIADGRLGIVL